MYIIDPTQHYADEFWKAYKNSNGTWTVGYYIHTDLFSLGIGSGGVWAAQDSGLGGVIRAGELNGNLRWPKDAYAIEHAIPHAIAIATTRALQRDAWVWPAISNDVGGKPDLGYKGVVPMGQFVAIPGGVDLTKLGFQSTQGLELAFALQNYGAYLVNSSSNYSFYAEMAAANDIGQINHPLSGHQADIDVLQRSLACVDYNGPSSPGSGSLNGAQRRVCWAPWLPTETPIANQCVYNRTSPLPMPH